MKKQKIKMFHDLLLAKPIKAPEKTSGGLYIPDEAKDESRYLEVLAVGKKVRGIEVGETIITIGQSPGGQDFHFNGEDLVVMREKYVFGVME